MKLIEKIFCNKPAQSGIRTVGELHNQCERSEVPTAYPEWVDLRGADEAVDEDDDDVAENDHPHGTDNLEKVSSIH